MKRILRAFSATLSPRGPEPRDLTSLVVTTADDEPGALNTILSCFVNRKISLARIESKFHDPLLSEAGHSFMIDVYRKDKDVLDAVMKDLKEVGANAVYIGGYEVPWFPKSRKDLDFLDQRLMEAGADLQADHPGFKDEDYRARRREICEIALNYRLSHGPVPKVNYTDKETKTWKTIYETLDSLHQSHACLQFNNSMSEMKKHSGFEANRIPQISEINDYLSKKTGFLLRPVAGLLTGRDFLNSLAFRVFSSTQYIRHHSAPFYTPEPDIVHEFLGHVPMFADLDFANFSQEIGLASLGANDSEIAQLSTCYWYSVEFGLIHEGGRKVYGAGILSSVNEMKNAISPAVPIREFDPFLARNVPYPITTLQPMYWTANSFKEMKDLMRKYAFGINRGFSLTYNFSDQSVRTDRSLSSKR